MGKNVKKGIVMQSRVEEEHDTTLDKIPEENRGALAEMFTAEALNVAQLVKDGFQAVIQKTLKAGEAICGIYLGPGGSVMVRGMKDGDEPQSVNTWRIGAKKGGVIVNLLGSYQLDARLQKMAEGTEVVIQHLGQVETRRGQRANDYLIFEGRAPKASLPAASQNGEGVRS